MLDAGLDTTRCVESIYKVLPSVVVLPLLVPGMAGGVCIDHRSVADRVEVTR